MSLSPLAARIYQALVRQARSPKPLVTYGDLVRALGPLPPLYADLKANDQRLFDALGEIVRACRSNQPPLPVLTSIVVRRAVDGSLGIPGDGYFVEVFPHVRDDAARLQVWQGEVRRVGGFAYPKQLPSGAASQPGEPQVVPRWLREPTVIAAIIGLAGTLLTVLVTVWISSRRDQRPEPSEAGRVAERKAPQGDEPQPRVLADPPEEKKAPHVLTLDEILEMLERHHQRATFGAVAQTLGLEPRSLFNGYRRSPRTSWVVSKTTGLPTGTKEADYPPGLLQNRRVIDSPGALRMWLLDHH